MTLLMLLGGHKQESSLKDFLPIPNCVASHSSIAVRAAILANKHFIDE